MILMIYNDLWYVYEIIFDKFLFCLWLIYLGYVVMIVIFYDDVLNDLQFL